MSLLAEAKKTAGSHNHVLVADNYADFESELRLSDCRRCPLSAERHNIVIHRGNPQAKIFIIGEAPGEKEDLEGKAFIGRAGKMLDKVMLSIGIDTNHDTFIANIAKCRPPKNRVPHQAEVSTCIPYLHKQLQLLNPDFILLLGSTALKHILPEKKKTPMKEIVGQFFDHADYPHAQIMVLYHPAYLLYDPRKKEKMLEHLKKLKACLV